MGIFLWTSKQRKGLIVAVASLKGPLDITAIIPNILTDKFQGQSSQGPPRPDSGSLPNLILLPISHKSHFIYLSGTASYYVAQGGLELL
jgi:hypothetical protein